MLTPACQKIGCARVSVARVRAYWDGGVRVVKRGRYRPGWLGVVVALCPGCESALAAGAELHIHVARPAAA